MSEEEKLNCFMDELEYAVELELLKPQLDLFEK